MRTRITVFKKNYIEANGGCNSINKVVFVKTHNYIYQKLCLYQTNIIKSNNFLKIFFSLNCGCKIFRNFSSIPLTVNFEETAWPKMGDGIVNVFSNTLVLVNCKAFF